MQRRFRFVVVVACSASADSSNRGGSDSCVGVMEQFEKTRSVVSRADLGQFLECYGVVVMTVL